MHAKKNIIMLCNMLAIEGLFCYRYDGGDNEYRVVVAFENERMERNMKNVIVIVVSTETSSTDEN
jgi:hypothetical protein